MHCAGFVNSGYVTLRQRKSGTGGRRHCYVTLCSNPPCAVSKAQVHEYKRYLTDFAKTRVPKFLDGLLHILNSADDERLVQPSDRGGVHPFLVPLTRNDNTGRVTGLLRWPTAPADMEMPVVRSITNELAVELLSPSARSHVHRAVASADCGGRTEAAQVIIGCTEDNVNYTQGDVEKSGLGFERYTTMHIGAFPDIYQGLANFHAAKQDISSALITCERANTLFPGWGSPHVFHANKLKEFGRDKEARDAARFALQLPLWTLGGRGRLLRTAKLAGYQDEDSLKRIYERLYEDKREKEIADGKQPEQVALDRAAYLLDYTVASGQEDWGNVTEPLAALYEEASMGDIATFVKY